MPIPNPAPKLAAEEYEKNFAEISPRMTRSQALAEAARCLFCFDAPCTKACPTHIDVPAFIKKIHSGNLRGSARVILEANILGHSCGRVCPTEALCEGACVMNLDRKPAIEIGRLQRYAVEHVLDNRVQLFHPGPANGFKVACVGAGPASLACAAELAKWGFSVSIFDKNVLGGGLNTYGIAAYKTRAEDSLREVDLVRQLGVTFCQGVEVGKDITFTELEQQFHAVFLGLGLGETWNLSLPGEDLHGVVGAIGFIEQTKTKKFLDIEVGRRVACIGAGNTAIDVVTAARRLGAEFVYLIYRRSEAEMPAFKYEYELAKRDGVIFYWQTQPVRVLGSNGVVTGLECVRTRLGDPDARGRRRPEPIPGTEFVIDVDMVVPAVGQQPVTEILRAVLGIDLHKDGRVIVNAGFQTSHPKYFAGGDCVNGGKEVVDAVAEGMAAARGIDQCLGRPRAVKRSGE